MVMLSFNLISLHQIMSFGEFLLGAADQEDGDDPASLVKLIEGGFTPKDQFYVAYIEYWQLPHKPDQFLQVVPDPDLQEQPLNF